MKIEWVDNQRLSLSGSSEGRFGPRKIYAFGNGIWGIGERHYLFKGSLPDNEDRHQTLDEAKAHVESVLRELAAPFVEEARAESALAEREACAQIADRAERRHAEVLSGDLPEHAAHHVQLRLDEALEIALDIRARMDGVK